METKKAPADYSEEAFLKIPAIPTFALVGTIIGSESLTSVFGMGTGITFRIWSPERHSRPIRPRGPMVLLIGSWLSLIDAVSVKYVS